MPNESIIKNDLEYILESISLIMKRFEKIKTPDDFVTSLYGLTQLDSIAMRLQVIGETIKNIEKTHPNYFSEYTEIDWQKIIRLRDIISHHYRNINPKIIFNICKINLPSLENIIIQKLKKF